MLTVKKLRRLIREELDALESWEDKPRQERLASLSEDEEAALAAASALMDALDKIGDYDHFEQVGRVLNSMRKTYQSGR